MKALYIQITDTTSEDEIDSILLEDMHADIKYIFVGDTSVAARLKELSDKYGIQWMFLDTAGGYHLFQEKIL